MLVNYNATGRLFVLTAAAVLPLGCPGKQEPMSDVPVQEDAGRVSDTARTPAVPSPPKLDAAAVHAADASIPPEASAADSSTPVSIRTPEVLRPVLRPSEDLPTRMRLVDSSGFATSRGLEPCLPGLGNSVAQIDLHEVQEGTAVTLIVQAPFATEAALYAGPEQDPYLVACLGESLAPNAPIVFTDELPRGIYTLAIAADAKNDGSVMVHASLPFCRKAFSCENPIKLPNVNEQLVLINKLCGAQHKSYECLGRASEAFFELDLSNETQEQYYEFDVFMIIDGKLEQRSGLVHLSPWDGTSCPDSVSCGSFFGQLLPPARYLIGHQRWQNDVIAISRRELSCPNVVNDHCDRAILLSSETEHQIIRGNTACAAQAFTPEALEHSVSLFYKVDLRNRKGPTSAGVLSVEQLPTEDAWFEVTDNGKCGRPLKLWPTVLAPREYVFSISGAERAVGSFVAELKLDSEPLTRTSCVSDELAHCATGGEPDCESWLDHPLCIQALLDCGLKPEALASTCEQNPECCTGTQKNAGCTALFEASGAVCSECRGVPGCGWL